MLNRKIHDLPAHAISNLLAQTEAKTMAFNFLLIWVCVLKIRLEKALLLRLRERSPIIYHRDDVLRF